MILKTHDLGKKYLKEWVFKNFTFSFESQKSYAITGHNGSGKSTLLTLLSGIEPASLGIITMTKDDKNISIDSWYKYQFLVSPVQELPEELTLEELLVLHSKLTKTDYKELRALISIHPELNKSFFKQIKHFSSGMKQRVKLSFLFGTNRDVLLLDEPTSYLDTTGIDWYLSKMEEMKSLSKMMIISSNQKHEYSFCDQVISIEDYK